MIKISKLFNQGKHDVSFGNNIVQLMIGLIVAKREKYNGISFQKCYLFNTTEINIANDSINNDTIGTFYNANSISLGNKEIKLKNQYNHYDYIEICRKYLTNIINIQETHFSKINMDVIENTLFIHIRSGDIFENDIHPAYVQPPVSFYKYIIKNNDYAQIIIVSENFSNPCIKILLEEYPNIILLKSNNQLDDVSVLMQSRNFVCGFGTFGYSNAFLNKNIKKLYIPKYCDIFFDNSITQFKIIKININNYIKIGDWKATSEQLDLMKTHSIDDIELFK